MAGSIWYSNNKNNNKRNFSIIYIYIGNYKLINLTNHQQSYSHTTYCYGNNNQELFFIETQLLGGYLLTRTFWFLTTTAVFPHAHPPLFPPPYIFNNTPCIASKRSFILLIIVVNQLKNNKGFFVCTTIPTKTVDNDFTHC